MQKFDIAVIGAGIAGLSAAALLSKAGKKVLLADPSGAAGGCIAITERKPFRFSAGHDLTYGFETGGALQSLYAALGLSLGGLSRVPSYQVALPDRRLTIAADPRATMEELRREFPSEIDTLSRLYREVSKIALRCSKSRIATRLIHWRSAKALLRSYALSPELTAYFDAQSRFFFGRCLLDLPLASLVLMLDTVPRSLPGGFSYLAEQLLAVIIEQKGLVMRNEPWPELLFHGRRVSGIRTSRETIETGAVLLNVSGEPWGRTLFLGIREEALPVGMERTVVCLPDYLRPADIFSLSISPSREGRDAPPGMRCVTASFPGLADSTSDRDALRERVQRIMPFLSDFIEVIDEQDPEPRKFVLPQQIAGKKRDNGQGYTLPVSAPLKNLYLLRDSPHALHQAVRSTQLLVSRLG